MTGRPCTSPAWSPQKKKTYLTLLAGRVSVLCGFTLENPLAVVSLEFILLFPLCIFIELLVCLFKFCGRFFPCGCLFISEFCFGTFVHRLNRCFYCASFLQFFLVCEYLILNLVFAICWSVLRQLTVLFPSLNFVISLSACFVGRSVCPNVFSCCGFLPFS